MKRYIFDICAIISVFVLIMFIAEWWIIPNVPNLYNDKYNYVANHKDDISTLLMGNSYFENSLNPTAISDNAFDFAISGRWIYWDKELLYHFVPQMHNLHIVIFPMGYRWTLEPSPHIFENGKSASEFLYSQIYVYEKYMHIWYDKTPDKYLKWFALTNRTNETNVFTMKRHTDDDWTGQNPFYGQLPNWKTDQQQQVSPNIVDNPHLSESLVEYTGYLRDMAKICYEYNIRFIVVTPPCHDVFVANTRPKGIALLHQIIEDVRQEYPIEYKDYLQDEDYRADSLYYNCSHLNNIGATKFGAQIKADFHL